MPPVRAARLRLLALWVAVGAHAAAVTAVGGFSLNSLLGGRFTEYRPDVLATWLGLMSAPALLLSPFLGVVAGSRWSWPTLLGAIATAAGLIAWAAFTPNAPWLSVAGVLAILTAYSLVAVVAQLPSVSRHTTLRLPTVFVVIGSALLAGWLIGFQLGVMPTDGTARPAGYATALAALALASLLPARLPRPDAIALTEGFVRPFLAGARDAVGHRCARFALIGLFIWAFVAVLVLVGLLRLVDAGASAETWRRVTFGWFAAGLVGGLVLSAYRRHPFRHAWFVPYAATAAFASFLVMRFGGVGPVSLVIVGLALGATLTPLLNAYQTWTTPRLHGVAAGLALGGACAMALIVAVVLPSPADLLAARNRTLHVLIGVSAIAMVGAWRGFARALVEGTVEFPLSVMYRTRALGPGATLLSPRGPYLVIANHASWFDPLWLGQVLPAPTIPMMTSKFYDLPVISWLMRYVFGTIRVPEAAYRHEAPELREAVAALNRGECVVLFPEGYLRRKEEQPLRRFGRGVWQILSDRPTTPIFACWIEGNWGSYFSFQGGPPTKNKPFDFWRTIRIGIVGPFTVDAAMLDDHMATRTFLMHQVNSARAPLGLEPLFLPAVSEGEKE
jgi:1-acyl-sn-glycerol-3-phosphate acyltransferase